MQTTFLLSNKMLNITDGIEDLGGINWKLAACLAFSWIVVLLVLIKGICSLGKVRGMREGEKRNHIAICHLKSISGLIFLKALTHQTFRNIIRNIPPNLTGFHNCRLCISRLRFRTCCWPSCWFAVWLYQELLMVLCIISNQTSPGLQMHRLVFK